jgi:hypothetical protein
MISARFFISSLPLPLPEDQGLGIEIQKQGTDNTVVQQIPGIDQAPLKVGEVMAKGYEVDNLSCPGRKSKNTIHLGDEGQCEQYEQADQKRTDLIGHEGGDKQTDGNTRPT